MNPLIWRRLLARSDTSLAQLHTSLQLVFAWSGEHLHHFPIHGKDSGSHSTDTRHIPLSGCYRGRWQRFGSTTHRALTAPRLLTCPSAIIIDNYLSSPLHSRQLTVRGSRMLSVQGRTAKQGLRMPAAHRTQSHVSRHTSIPDAIQVPGEVHAPESLCDLVLRGGAYVSSTKRR